MKNTLLVVVAVLLVVLGGWYFVIKPIQTSNAHKDCDAQANKAVFAAFTTYGTPSERKATYDQSYESCLSQHGF